MLQNFIGLNVADILYEEGISSAECLVHLFSGCE